MLVLVEDCTVETRIVKDSMANRSIVMQNYHNRSARRKCFDKLRSIKVNKKI